jgi:hypothetical protein
MPATIHLSESQFALFQKAGVAPGQAPDAPKTPRARRKKEDLPENQVEKQILDFLAIKNWTVIRQHVGTFVPYRVAVQNLPINGWDIVRINERGTPDYCAERAVPGALGRCERFWFEVKGSGGKPSPHQKEWLRKRALMGWLAGWFDCFDDVEFGEEYVFLPFYKRHFA